MSFGSQTLILNSSSENRKLQYLAINLGIPSAPTLNALTDNFTLVSIRLHYSLYA